MKPPQWLHGYQQRSESVLESCLGRLEPVAPRLLEAMSYALLGQGKRIRPALVYAGATAAGSINAGVDAVACAVECIHAYSLVHDDLPAMDDDQLRRGQPTCHVAFDEATAILAGDALQGLAFQVIAEAEGLQPATQIQLIHQLALASGSSGMVGGQALDLAAVARSLNLQELESMHSYKTGALIRASVCMGAMATETSSPATLQALQRYAACIGLAFQVQDDILDVTGSTEVIGKQQGADALRDKPTYVSLLGLAQARNKTTELHEMAMEALAGLDERANQLRELSRYIVGRLN